MELLELREAIGKENYGNVPKNNKIYINVDRNEISVGFPEDYIHGMRAVCNNGMYEDYYTFEQLLKDMSVCTISDEKYDVSIPKGTPVPLCEDLDEWDVYLSEEIERALLAQGIVEEGDL